MKCFQKDKTRIWSRRLSVRRGRHVLRRPVIVILASAVAFIFLLTGCEQKASLHLDLPDGAQRGVLALTIEEFTSTFNAKAEEAGVERRKIGKPEKSTAGVYDRYTYRFDGTNDIVFDCPGEQQTISALYLINRLSERETAGNAASAFGACISLMIYSAAENAPGEIQELLDTLGITSGQPPSPGFQRGVRMDDVYYQIRVEEDSILFSMVALVPA